MMNHYDAFISYRHLPEDKIVAIKLQNYLERLKIKDANTGKKRHLCIFRDQSELFTSNDLGANIRAALDSSDFLIILYSHTTKESKWCMEELNYFRSLHENTNCKVLPLIIEGEPDEVFPEVLRWEERRITVENGESQVVKAKVEPLGADIRESNFSRKLHKLKKAEYMRIAAPIMGCRFDELYKRNFRRRVRIGAIISCFVLLVCFLVFLLFYRQKNSELTQAAAYSIMAKQQEEKEQWQEALMYYNEAVSRNPSLSFEASSALLLLQEQQWPCITKIDNDRHIMNGVLEPSVLEAYEKIAEPAGGSIRAMDSTVSYYLVDLGNDENQYGVYNLEGIQTALLENVGTVMYDSYEQDYWAFYRQDGMVTLYNPAENTSCAFMPENMTQYSGLIHVIPPLTQRIKNELDKQNEIIFKAEHERNLLEIERDDLHGISRLTKKRELDSKIERKNEEIDILKSGLSGIVKRYGFDTVQQFYNAIKIAQDATYKYQMDVATWEENYGEKTPPKATFEERLRIYQREADQQHTQRNYHSRDKGAR